MADGYARVSDPAHPRAGVCSVHQGPGLHERDDGPGGGGQGADAAAGDRAARRRPPRCGPTSASTRRASPRPSGRSRSASTRARAPPPTRPARCGARRSSGGPVVLNMPLDVQAQDAGDEAPPSPDAAAFLRPAPSAAAVEAVAALIADARRPLILAGRGAVLAGAREPLEALGDADRRRARHLRDGPRAVRRLAVDGRHLGRVRLAGRRPADPPSPTSCSPSAPRSRAGRRATAR